MTNLESIRARDTASGDLWFKGPESFTALAARDRRALLAEVDRLMHDIEAGNAEIERLCKLHGPHVEPTPPRNAASSRPWFCEAHGEQWGESCPYCAQAQVYRHK